MPPIESPAVLVARFLRANNYEETLQAFLREAGLDHSAGAHSKHALTVEQLLHEKSIYDLSQTLEKVGVDDQDAHWPEQAPSRPQLVESIGTSANILFTSVESVRPVPDVNVALDQVLLASTADRSLHALSIDDGFKPTAHHLPASDSPVLCCHVLANRFLITGAMSGKLSLYNFFTGNLLAERRDHQKYIVRIAIAQAISSGGIWLASAAWDGKVLLYYVDLSSGPPPTLRSPRAKIELSSNPECIAFVNHPELQQPVLLVSRKDSTFLFYYALPSILTADSSTCAPLVLLGRQNLAPHSNAWIAFTPSAFALSPKDPSILAVATSHTPHMKLIIARLLLPPPKPDSEDDEEDTPDAPSSAVQHLTQASQARADLALQDREDAAILVQSNTMAPQTPYSTPALAFRPDGSGVWVNGDDGVLRGLEVTTGKIITTLTGAHESGTKVRCLWAGLTKSRDGEQEEIIVSGGFDRRLVVWR